MTRNILATLFCLAILAAPQVSLAQDDDMRISTGIGIGTQGFHTSVDIQLVDELDVPYDTYSLLKRPEIREAIGVSDEQFIDLHQVHSELTQEVKEKLADLIVSEDKSLVEDRFFEVESQLTGALSAQQLEQLAQISLQESIASHGLIKVLNTERIQQRLELKEQDQQTLAQLEDSMERSSTKADCRIANERLIAELNDEQANQLESYFENFDSGFLAQPLFAGKHQKAFSKRVTQNSLWLTIGSRQTRTDLKLTESQTNELKQLRRTESLESDAAKLIQGVLSIEQAVKFHNLVAARETKRWGTARALANGHLKSLLNISDQESEKLVKLGQQLHREVLQQQRVAQIENTLEQLTMLSGEQREKVRELIGEPIELPKR